MGFPKHHKTKTKTAGVLVGANQYTGKFQPVAEFKTNNRYMRRLKGQTNKKKESYGKDG